MKLFPVKAVAPSTLLLYSKLWEKYYIPLFLVTAVLIQTIYLYISSKKFEDQGNESEEVCLT